MTRESEIRDCTMPLGFDQSVSDMCFHTTSTRIGDDAFCDNIFWIAEAPRKHKAQVGESSSTKRIRSTASLKTCWNVTRLLVVSEVSGGWPDGARDEPQ